MKTRELTSEERTALDTLWQKYLNGESVCKTAQDAINLWTEYSNGYRAIGIVPTLAGYRKVLCA